MTTEDSGRVPVVAYTLRGVPLAECPREWLENEYMAGIYMDSSEGLDANESARLRAVEKEFFSRPAPEGEDV